MVNGKLLILIKLGNTLKFLSKIDFLFFVFRFIFKKNMITYSDVYEITSRCVLPVSIKKLILKNIDKYTPQGCEELRAAVAAYPENIDRYGSIEFWNITNLIPNMRNIFDGKIINFDLSQWDVSYVRNMNNMFVNCNFKINPKIHNWNVSNVKNMRGMFASSNFRYDISNWNTSKVEDMSYMFSYCSFNHDISLWNVSNVLEMEYMFSNSKFNQDLARWNTKKVTTMKGMFINTNYQHDLMRWNTSNLKNSYNMFLKSKYPYDKEKFKVENDRLFRRW